MNYGPAKTATHLFPNEGGQAKRAITTTAQENQANEQDWKQGQVDKDGGDEVQ
jgi:hypothetical protein